MASDADGFSVENKVAAAYVAILEGAFQFGKAVGLRLDVDGEFFQERLTSLVHGGREGREGGSQAGFT